LAVGGSPADKPISALGHREAGDRIHQAQHILALSSRKYSAIAKVR